MELQHKAKQQEVRFMELQHMAKQQEVRITALQHVNKHRLKMMRANLLSDFVKKICGNYPVPSTPVQNSLGHDSSRLAIDAAPIDRKNLLKGEVGPKYVDVLKKFQRGKLRHISLR